MTATATPTDPDPNPLRPRPRRGTAVVAWYNTEKGFGFLTPDRGGPPIFLRHNAIAVPGYRTLRPGQTVRYTATDTPRGPEATHVEPLGGPSSRTAHAVPQQGAPEATASAFAADPQQAFSAAACSTVPQHTAIDSVVEGVAPRTGAVPNSSVSTSTV